MALMFRRFISCSALLRDFPTLATPILMTHQPVLDTPELQSIQQKARGPWKDLTNEEMVKLYRATFPMSFKEIKQDSKKDNWKVFFGTCTGITVGVVLAEILRRQFGPEKPHTVDNPEWEAAKREKLLRQKANPIEGMSSKYAS